MFGDITKRHERMKRLPPVTLKDYAIPLVYAVVTVPMLYVLMFAYYVIVNAVV